MISLDILSRAAAMYREHGLGGAVRLAARHRVAATTTLPPGQYRDREWRYWHDVESGVRACHGERGHDHAGAWLAGLNFVRVPPRFWHDCNDCDCEVGFMVGTKGRCLLVACTDAELAELVSRAQFYVHPNGPSDAPAGLKPSARATLNALIKQGVE